MQEARFAGFVRMNLTCLVEKDVPDHGMTEDSASDIRWYALQGVGCHPLCAVRETAQDPQILQEWKLWEDKSVKQIVTLMLAEDLEAVAAGSQKKPRNQSFHTNVSDAIRSVGDGSQGGPFVLKSTPSQKLAKNAVQKTQGWEMWADGKKFEEYMGGADDSYSSSGWPFRNIVKEPSLYIKAPTGAPILILFPKIIVGK